MSYYFVQNLYGDWLELQALIQQKGPLILNGNSLNIPSVVAVAHHHSLPTVSKDVILSKAVDDSVRLVESHLNSGQTVYGVNTGFGASADTRTKSLHLLQKSLLQHQSAGILTARDLGETGTSIGSSISGNVETLAMPADWVRAMMLIRCNSLLRGHSGVRLSVIESIASLIAYDLTPILPLRGSISASGDLMPLSYLAGLLEGNTDIRVRTSKADARSQSPKSFMRADEALELAQLKPLSLGPKEGLGLMNGTAASCAAASITIHQVQHQALLVQIMTAMASEALLASKHNHDPFIANVRPHPGQIESAAVIFNCLRDSRLIADKESGYIGLFQDRYPLRTASQWIGPQLEDLLLASRQVQVELNSTTDNPLVDVQNGLIHHGGNFQAASLTSAMSKVLNALQMLGRLIHAQSSELLNCTINRGLPPNLCFDDPSRSSTLKGVDVSMSAYMSELAYIAHPVSSYVQSAEMHNQAVNSLALLAARHSSEASNVLNLMSANYLYSLCQALDLRCLHIEFVGAAEAKISALLHRSFKSLSHLENFDLERLHAEMWAVAIKRWLECSSFDLDARASATADTVLGALLNQIRQHPALSTAHKSEAYAAVQDYALEFASTLVTVYETRRTAFAQQPTTPAYLGRASRAMYHFVRQVLGVPLHQGLIEHPTVDGSPLGDAPREKVTIGTQISKIYEALRSGAIHQVGMEIISELRLAKQGDDESRSSDNVDGVR
ncbi:hypothetical protein DSL72_008605 [Monilinia vaccinii-corymbosi]|uniref:Phenylalanine ammonia-lyase n=1 Tax=Monilinia vaccinii-corymbosi TaxID=61207 RepID=A0A8A3PPR2_9HELO|nr:hypothetical protein DSL72_008605 [Monilinia vaccinii-corymbosi]